MLTEPLYTVSQQDRFLEKAANVASIVLGGGCVASLLALLYFLYHYSWTRERKFDSPMGVVLYYLVPAGVAALFFASLKLTARYKINLAILSVSLAASAIGVEVFLQLSSPLAPKLAVWQVQGQSEEKKQRTREFARQYGVDFDTRDAIEILRDLRKSGVEAVPNVSRWLDIKNNLWNWQPDGTIQSAVKIAGEEVIPLGAVANGTTILCNEGGQWITYLSDEHGFSNPKGIYDSEPLDIGVLGDSFAQGFCVPPDSSSVALIRQRYPATLNLGIAGNGPLLELATLKEYLSSLKPRHVLWFYYEGNDLTGLRTEKKIPLVMRYLKGDFSQGLVSRQHEIDQALRGLIDSKMAETMNQPPPRRNWFSNGLSKLVGIVALSSLRQRLGLVQGKTSHESEMLSDLNGPNMDLFGQIMMEAKSCVNAWGGTLHFVYLPSFSRYFGSPEVGVGMRARVLSAVSSLVIPVIDINTTFQAHGDVSSFFPWGGYGHYNAKGHRVVAEEVLKAIDPSGRSVRTFSASSRVRVD